MRIRQMSGPRGTRDDVSMASSDEGGTMPSDNSCTPTEVSGKDLKECTKVSDAVSCARSSSCDSKGEGLLASPSASEEPKSPLGDLLCDDDDVGKWEPGTDCGPFVGSLCPLQQQSQVLVANVFLNAQ